MSITDTTVKAGDPTIQADGTRRGTIIFMFDDGRVVERRVRAPDANAWTNLVVDLASDVEASEQRKDADELAEQDVEITAHKQASIKQVAVRFLRKAYATGHPLSAYQKFSRFNDYRIAQGWTLGQVQAQLASEGLEADEWQNMRDRYAYLSNAARVTAMQAYQSVLDGDTWGAEFRE